jgi:D-arginine dehydrogenase
LKVFSNNGGTLLNSTEVLELKKQKNGWLLKTNQGEFVTKIIVNAAGAWAEQIGSLSCAECIGLTPKRITALIVDPPNGADLSMITLVIDIDEQFYLQQMKIQCSPAMCNQMKWILLFALIAFSGLLTLKLQELSIRGRDCEVLW